MKLSEANWKHGNCETKQQQIDLKEGDIYYFIENNGGIIQETLRSIDFNIIRLLIGNVFLTRYEAKIALEKLKVEAILNKYSHDFSKEEWIDDDVYKYYIGYIENNNQIHFPYDYYIKKQGTIYFKTEEDCQNAIDEIGEQRLINYFEGVL